MSSVFSRVNLEDAGTVGNNGVVPESGIVKGSIHGGIGFEGALTTLHPGGTVTLLSSNTGSGGGGRRSGRDSGPPG